MFWLRFRTGCSVRVCARARVWCAHVCVCVCAVVGSEFEETHPTVYCVTVVHSLRHPPVDTFRDGIPLKFLPSLRTLPVPSLMQLAKVQSEREREKM